MTNIQLLCQDKLNWVWHGASVQQHRSLLDIQIETSNCALRCAVIIVTQSKPHTSWYCTALYCTALQLKNLYCAVMRSMHYYTTLHWTVLHCTISHQISQIWVLTPCDSLYSHSSPVMLPPHTPSRLCSPVSKTLCDLQSTASVEYKSGSISVCLGSCVFSVKNESKVPLHSNTQLGQEGFVQIPPKGESTRIKGSRICSARNVLQNILLRNVTRRTTPGMATNKNLRRISNS